MGISKGTKILICKLFWLFITSIIIAFIAMFLARLFGINIGYAGIILIVIAMIFSIYTVIKDLDNNSARHEVARYAFKGLWYAVATVATIIIGLDELNIFDGTVDSANKDVLNNNLLVFKLILFFIVFYECLDNFKSMYVEDKRIKEKEESNLNYVLLESRVLTLEEEKNNNKKKRVGKKSANATELSCTKNKTLKMRLNEIDNNLKDEYEICEYENVRCFIRDGYHVIYMNLLNEN